MEKQTKKKWQRDEKEKHEKGRNVEMNDKMNQADTN